MSFLANESRPRSDGTPSGQIESCQPENIDIDLALHLLQFSGCCSTEKMFSHEFGFLENLNFFSFHSASNTETVNEYGLIAS
jgi:hypothetical protein